MYRQRLQLLLPLLYLPTILILQLVNNCCVQNNLFTSEKFGLFGHKQLCERRSIHS